MAAVLAVGAIAWFLGRPSDRPEEDDAAPIAAVAPVPVPRSTQLSAGGWPEGEPAMNPDGRRLAFIRIVGGQRTLVLKDLETEVETPIPIGEVATSPGTPRWSPDGTTLVFASAGARRGLYTLIVDDPSAIPQRVAAEGFHPAFSRDGKHIAFSTGRVGRPGSSRDTAAIKVLDRSTLELRILPAGDANQPAWSPDGSRLAYWGLGEDGFANAWTLEVATGATTPLTTGAAVDWNPVWAHDGRGIYFLSDRNGGEGLFWLAVDPASGEPLGEPVPLGATLHERPGMLDPDPAGGWIAFDTSVWEENVLVVDLDAEGRLVGAPSRVTRGGRNVLWSEPSPGGDRVVWVEVHRGIEDVRVGPADGSASRKLTDDPHHDREPRWLDEDRIVFYSDRGGAWSLWVVAADGSGDPTPVNDGGQTTTFVLSAAGTIAASLDHQEEIVLLEVGPDGRQTSRQRAIFDRPEGIKPYPSSWSPDGRLLIEGAELGGTERWVGAWDPATGEVVEGDASLTHYRWLDDRMVLASGPTNVVRFAWPDGDRGGAVRAARGDHRRLARAGPRPSLPHRARGS